MTKPPKVPEAVLLALVALLWVSIVVTCYVLGHTVAVVPYGRMCLV